MHFSVGRVGAEFEVEANHLQREARALRWIPAFEGGHVNWRRVYHITFGKFPANCHTGSLTVLSEWPSAARIWRRCRPGSRWRNSDRWLRCCIQRWCVPGCLQSGCRDSQLWGINKIRRVLFFLIYFLCVSFKKDSTVNLCHQVWLTTRLIKLQMHYTSDFYNIKRY